MKKWLSATLIALLLFPLLSPLKTKANYNAGNAQVYLAAHSGSPWSTMALAALESSAIPTDHLVSINAASAIEYAAPILAITAINQNPRTFASTDYVAALKSYHTGGQMGDPAALNDDFFGILALVSAGESLNNAVIADSKNFILSHQNGDGGWGYTVTSGSDTNMTAAAILALLSAGVDRSDSHIQNALSFLQSLQNSDGGFPYYPESASDSSSTAWTIWVFNALDIDPSSLVKSGQTPVSYLESNQSGEGFFKFQNDSKEDDFSAVTTAYAVIALEGKKLPIRVAANGAQTQKFSFRIEGSKETVCSGETFGPTALDVVRNASGICGFTYEIENTDWGSYLKKINNEEAKGMTGWLYLVNYSSPSVGAADYRLQEGDFVLWYYGDFNWRPIKLTLSAGKIGSDQSAVATVEVFDDDLWFPLANAVVYFGAEIATTGSDGRATVNLADGFYKVYAQKQGFVRSNSGLLKVGEPASSSVDLVATIKRNNGNNTGDVISFTVDPNNLDFGTLDLGSSVSKNITINNNGTIDINVEAIVSGDSLFVDNLDLNDVIWKNFKTGIGQGGSQNVDARLSVPANYSAEIGEKSAQLTFWATAQSS